MLPHTLGALRRRDAASGSTRPTSPRRARARACADARAAARRRCATSASRRAGARQRAPRPRAGAPSWARTPPPPSRPRSATCTGGPGDARRCSTELMAPRRGPLLVRRGPPRRRAARRRSSVRNGRVERRRQRRRPTGIGVRVRVGGGWGFAATRDVSAAGRRGARSRARWRSPRRSPPRPARAARARRRRRAATGPRRTSSTRSTSRSRTSSTACSPPRRALRRRRRASCAASRRARAGASARRSPRPTAPRARRSAWPPAPGIAAVGARRRRAAGALVPAARTAGCSRPPAGSTCSRSTSPAHAPRVAAEAVELLSAPPCPRGRTTLVLDGEQLALQIHESIGHALELDRILLGEAVLRRDELGRARRPRLAALRLRAPDDHRRRDAARRAGLVRLGRRGRRRAPLRRSSSDGVLRATLSDRESAAAIGLDASGGCARADGFARQPIVRMTNVSIEPGDAGIARGPDRRHRRRPATSRRTARGRSTTAACTSSSPPRSRARSAAASSGGCCATRPTPASRRGSGARSTPSAAPEEWRLWGLTNCGKGEPGQVMARLARRRARALPRRPGRRRVSATRVALELAERALAPRRAATRRRRSIRERSLMSRFARSAPTQATAGRRHERLGPARARRPHRRGRRRTTSTDDGAARRRRARRRERAAAAARAAGEPGDAPRPARARAGRAPHDGFDPATARLDPARAGAALAQRVRRRAPSTALEAFGIWTRGRGRDGDRLVDGHPRARRRDRRAT